MEDATKNVTNQLCRLRLVVGKRSVELALPTDVALVDLLPAILHQAGGQFADEGVEHEGWVLQRLGKAPFDENRTPEELDLQDGETVHLRPRAAELPEIDFDDLVDGIADQAKGRRDNWTDRYSRWMLLAFGGLALLLGLGTLMLPGPALARTVFPALVAVALLTAATIVSRSRGDSITATVLAFASVPYAAVCGWMLPVSIAPDTDVGPSLACALVFVVVALSLGMLGTADAALLYVGGLFATVIAAVTALIDAASPFELYQAAAIGAVLCMVVLGFVPTTSFRLAKLSLPALPTGADDFGEDTEPFPYQEVVERSAVANSYMTALYLSLGSVLLVLVTLVLAHPSIWTMILIGVLGVVSLLRSRHISGGGVQRWAQLVPGGYALSGDLLLLAAGVDPFARMLFLTGGSLLLGALLIVGSKLLPGKKLRPYWGRAVDIFESLTAVALLPLLLAVLDTYMWVRGLSG